jgi:serine/threonine protein kinase
VRNRIGGVKVLLGSHTEKPELVRRFVEEAQIGGQLQHPGVVPVYELGTLGDRRPYFTMKLVKGQTHAELLGERSAPSNDLPRFLSIFRGRTREARFALDAAIAAIRRSASISGD